MRNEIAGKRIGNGNKRAEKERNCWCRLKKAHNAGEQGRLVGEGEGERRQETNASSIKQKCSVNSRETKK